MNIGSVVENSVRIYFKNIVVNLFFSALLMLLPYLQYVLIKNSVGYVVCAILVFISAFLSVAVVYIPFIVSIRRGRITQLWRKLLRDALPISFMWAVLCTVLFLATYFIINNAENPLQFLLMPIVIAFFLWELVILKCANIVSNAEKEYREKTSLLSVLAGNIFSLIKALISGMMLFILFPIGTNAFLNRRRLYPNNQAANAQEFEIGSTIFFIFLIFPFVVVFLNYFFCELTGE